MKKWSAHAFPAAALIDCCDSREKARVAASASLEAPFVWIKSITVWLVVVRKASLLEGKVCGSAAKPFVDYNCIPIEASSYSVWSLPFLSNSNASLQPVTQQHMQFNHLHTVSRPVLAATRAFPLITTVNQCSSRESMCTPLFHLGKSQSTSCTRCSDLDRLSAR